MSSDIRYDKTIPTYGDVMTVADFLESCRDGMFIDYDGHGHAAKDGWCSSIRIYPSALESIPSDATHIVWYNR